MPGEFISLYADTNTGIFTKEENYCLFKCFFISSTSNLATYEVCHGERGDKITAFTSSLHFTQKSLCHLLHFLLFSALLCLFHPELCISKLTFNQMFLPQRPLPIPYPHTSTSFTDIPFNSNTSLSSLTFKCVGMVLVPLFYA